MTNNFFNKSFVTVNGITPEDVKAVCAKADKMKALVEKQGGSDELKGKILGALFYEPSSRTFSSFITAMQRLGGGIIPLSGMGNTSAAKGETIADTARVFSSYADVLAVRHPLPGVPAEIARHSSVPVINAGDGTGEHPTQALLDTYTISKHLSSFSELTVGLIGDLTNGRTVHSLSKILALMGVRKFVFISPTVLAMPAEIKVTLQSQGSAVTETDDLAKTIPELDVIYMTRVQKERFTDEAEYERLKLSYIVTKELMSHAKKTAVLMHPLPRVGEIAQEVDSDPRALYFREQLKNGMYVRMALLSLILKTQ